MKIKNPMIIGIFAAVLLLLASDGYAQIQAPGVPKRELLLFEEIPIVTSVARRPQSIKEAMASISVITADEIRAMEPENIWDVFRRVPGVDVMTQDGRTGIVAPRGFPEDMTRYNQVLIDGRSVYSPIYGGTGWEFLALFPEDIKRIEVIRGPHILYGSNSFTGVINIITKDPEDVKGGVMKLTGGSHAYARDFVRYGDNFANTDFYVSYADHYDRGVGASQGREVNDWQRDTTFTLRGKHHIDDDSNWEVLAGVKDDTGRPPTTATGVTTIHNTDMLRDYEMIRYNRKLSESQNLKIHFYHNQEVENKHGNLAANPPQQATQLLSDTADSIYNTYDFELQHSFSWWKDAIKTVWGLTERYNRGFIYLFRKNNGKKAVNHIFSFFMNNDYKLNEQVTSSFGLVAERDDFTDWAISPKAGVLFWPAENQNIRFGYTRTYHRPTFLDLFYDASIGPRVVGNLELKKAVVDAFELGYRGSFIDNRLDLDAAIYHNEYENLIRTTTALSFDNANSAIAQGLELDLKYKFTDWMSAYTNYTAERIDDKKLLLRTSIPRHKANFGVQVFDKRTDITIDFDMNYVSDYISQDITSSSAPRTKINAYWRADLNITKSFWNGDAEVSLVGHNLFDDTHQEFVSASGGGTIFPTDINRTLYIVTKAKF